MCSMFFLLSNGGLLLLLLLLLASVNLQVAAAAAALGRGRRMWVTCFSYYIIGVRSLILYIPMRRLTWREREKQRSLLCFFKRRRKITWNKRTGAALCRWACERIIANGGHRRLCSIGAPLTDVADAIITTAPICDVLSSSLAAYK